MANILIVEDEAYLAEDLEYFIKERGHECTVMRHADDVMKDISSLSKFDKIVLDLMMMKGSIITDDYPDLETGEILFNEIRKLFPTKEVIILTAKNFDELTVDFKNDPNVKMMQKPLYESKIIELLEML